MRTQMTLTWNNSKITKIDLSVTNFCNAGCPQCDRTNPNGCGTDDWLPLTQWSLQDFKKAFPKDSLNQLGELQFCGTWGDPMMLKDIYSKPWIRDYTLAVCKVMIGEARGKFNTIASPQGGTSLNGGELKQQGMTEMERLDVEINNYVDGGTPHSFVIG